MKKIASLLAGVVLALGTLSSCASEDEYWAYETTQIRYNDIDDYYGFASALEALADGPALTVSQAKAEVGKVVREYDGDLECTVYFKTGPSLDGPWTIRKTWYMKLK